MGCLVGWGWQWMAGEGAWLASYFAYDSEEPLLQQLPLPRVQQSCHCSHHPLCEIIVILSARLLLVKESSTKIVAKESPCHWCMHVHLCVCLSPGLSIAWPMRVLFLVTASNTFFIQCQDSFPFSLVSPHPPWPPIFVFSWCQLPLPLMDGIACEIIYLSIMLL